MKRCHLYLTVLFVCHLSLTVAKAQLATDCTLYAAIAPTGNDTNNGTTSLTPKTFTGAANATVAGSTVCLEGGTYNLTATFVPPHSGTSAAHIVYKAYGDSTAIIKFVGPSGATMVRIQNSTYPTTPVQWDLGKNYLEFRNLVMDGNELATNAFSCNGSHHITFGGNTMKNTGGAGIAAINCDYLTADHNLVWHNGMAANSDPSYAPCCGWTGGISYNSMQFFDTYAGLHNLITNNIVAGEVDGSANHADGNGIMLDLSCRSGCTSLSTAHTPPALIMNNVVYMNGGKCILANIVSDFYVINNICYKNGLDSTLVTTPSEYAERRSNNGYFVNNIAQAWGGQAQNYSFDSDGTGSTNIYYFHEMWFVGGLNFKPTDPSQFSSQDPLFARPPSVDPSLGNQYARATDPALIGTALALQGSSPASRAGIDPVTIPGLSGQIAIDLRRYIYSDINGVARTAGNWNLGAYQSVPPAPPTGLTTTAH